MNDVAGISPLVTQSHDRPAAKACASCTRVDIGVHYAKVSPWRVFVGLPFVYLPILVMPFILLGGGLIYIHLRLMGAQNLKTLRDFLPAWDSHRYSYKTQIVKNDCHPLARWSRARAYWIFNCTFYCPFSVASLEWTSYLTKVVEIWWCPFGHATEAELRERRDRLFLLARLEGHRGAAPRGSRESALEQGRALITVQRV